MNLTRILIVTAMAVLLAACGETTEPETSTSGKVAEQVAEKAVEQVTAPAKPVVVVEESAGDDEPTSDESSKDIGADGKIVLAQAETAPAPLPQKYQAKTHYIKLATAQGTSSPPDVVEVAEVFWYGCPHCFNFDPIVDNWETKLPDDVNFIRLPVMWNPTNAIHARLFYTLEALGKLDGTHEAIFREIHINNKTLTNETEIISFVGKHGVSTEDFEKTFRSFAVESKLKRAKNLTQRYRIQSVPLLVINGKYLTSGKGIKNFDDMLAVADELIAREQQDR